MERNKHYEGGYTDHTPKQNELDNLHFARTYAFSLKAHGIELSEPLCQQWIREGFINEYEMGLIKQAYEELE